jgi:N-acetylglucosaminyl-diphospho-decaprenol L-rhamnosyltransferase
VNPFAVVIINYNTCELLRACLATVITEAPSEVVVVDNASSDDSVATVETEYPHVILQVNKTNLGYGAAANQAIASCKAKYVLLLNADTLLRPGTLLALKRYLDQHPRAAIVGPRLEDPDGTLQASCYPFPTPLHTFLENSTIAVVVGRRIRRHIPFLRNLYLRTWPHASPRIVPWVKGAALAVRRDAFEAVGGFDESFFMYFEDADLCYRLGRCGWEVHFTPTATVVHVGGTSTAQCHAEMAVQLLASTLKFYQRHSSRIRYAEVSTILKTMMLARWISGKLALYLTRDVRTRARLTEEIAASQKVILGKWQVQGSRTSAHDINGSVTPGRQPEIRCDSEPPRG